MKIRPLGNRLLVKQIKTELITKSGIVLEGVVEKEKKAEGLVVAMGSGEELSKLPLRVDDKVIFGKYAGEDFKISEDEEYKILEHTDILAVID